MNSLTRKWIFYLPVSFYLQQITCYCVTIVGDSFVTTAPCKGPSCDYLSLKFVFSLWVYLFFWSLLLYFCYMSNVYMFFYTFSDTIFFRLNSTKRNLFDLFCWTPCATAMCPICLLPKRSFHVLPFPTFNFIDGDLSWLYLNHLVIVFTIFITPLFPVSFCFPSMFTL